MQIKKDIIRNKLKEAGETEFFEKGFERSSVREIAGKAGTTLGNFYNYFKNKEELFHEVVKNEVIKFEEFFHGHQEEPTEYLIQSEREPAAFYRALDEFNDVLTSVFTRKFYIWVACSKGTQFSNSKDMVIRYIGEHFIGHVRDVGTMIPDLDNTAAMLSNGFLDGILYILGNHSDEKTVNDLIKNHLLFFFMGMIGLIEGFISEVAHD
ncbi:MAG TPA: TetR/AcrR family transcriptional regulator [Clostridia bacterium]|nr:TetR/AcrR family transcriptional regulator [Clostridia bacterium]HPQ45862.1 TetR/AcrR family transcriptional regulator [Clostridia bacterium]